MANGAFPPARRGDGVYETKHKASLRPAQFQSQPHDETRVAAQRYERPNEQLMLDAIRRPQGANAVAIATVFMDDKRHVHTIACPELTHKIDTIFRKSTLSRFRNAALSSVPASRFRPDVVAEEAEFDSEEASGSSRLEALTGSSARSSVAPASHLHRVPARRKGKREVRFSSEKRKRASNSPSANHSATASEVDEEEDQETQRLSKVQSSFALDDIEAIEAAYHRILEEIQQQSLKVILKKWIKVIEPRKQSNYPYCSSNQKPTVENNGKNSKKKQKTHETEKIPPWWPDNVHHREPDHIRKPERVKLARALLGLRLPDRPRLTNELHDATNAILGELRFRNEKTEKVDRRVRLLDALHHLAKQQHRVDNDEIDATDFITLPVLSEDPIVSRPAPQSTRRSSATSTEDSSTSTDFSHAQEAQQPFHTDPSTATFTPNPPGVSTQHGNPPTFFQSRMGLSDRLGGLTVTDAGIPHGYVLSQTQPYEMNQDMVKAGSQDMVPATTPQGYMNANPPPERLQYQYRPKAEYGYMRGQAPEEGASRSPAFLSPAIGQPQVPQFSSWQFPQQATGFPSAVNSSVQNMPTVSGTAAPMYQSQMEWTNSPIASNSQMAGAESYPVSPTHGTGPIAPFDPNTQQGYSQTAVPDLVGARAQPPAEMLYPGAALRTGSLSHPHPGAHGMPNTMYAPQNPPRY